MIDRTKEELIEVIINHNRKAEELAVSMYADDMMSPAAHREYSALMMDALEEIMREALAEWDHISLFETAKWYEEYGDRMLEIDERIGKKIVAITDDFLAR